MTISKKTLATILIGLASVIGIVSIFCFFGAAEKVVLSGGGASISENGPSMFIAMFGGTFTGQPISLQPGMTVLFVIELIILLCAIVLVAGNVSKKLKDSTSICIASIIALLSVVAVVMSFCTIALCGDSDIGGSIEGYSLSIKLGAGALSYSILGIVGIISNVAGIILYKKAN